MKWNATTRIARLFVLLLIALWTPPTTQAAGNRCATQINGYYDTVPSGTVQQHYYRADGINAPPIQWAEQCVDGTWQEYTVTQRQNGYGR
jgi:hypothetical protein